MYGNSTQAYFKSVGHPPKFAVCPFARYSLSARHPFKVVSRHQKERSELVAEPFNPNFVIFVTDPSAPQQHVCVFMEQRKILRAVIAFLLVHYRYRHLEFIQDDLPLNISSRRT